MTMEPVSRELKASLKPRHVAMIAIGGIIGAGLFVGSSTAIVTVGPAVIVSYLLAGLLVILVMRMISEMAVAQPGVTAFPDFARSGLGDWAGFVTGWLYWYFWVVVVAIEAIAGAAILQLWMPQFEVWQIGIVLLAVGTGINLLSTGSYGEAEFWLSSMKIAAILVFIALAAAFAFGLTAPAGPTFGNLFAHGGFAPMGWIAVLGGITTVIFSMTGAEIVVVAAAESEDPARTTATITGTVIARILIFYVLSISLIVAVIPWSDVVSGLSPFATALDAMHIPYAGTIMNAVVLVAVFSCLNSGMYVTSRVLFSLAARGEAPQSLVAINRRGVPARSILFGSLFGYAALAASVVSPGVVFNFLVSASGALMVVVYMLLGLAQLRVRARVGREAPERLTVRMWLHPWGSLLAIAGMLGVLVAMALTPGLASQFYASMLTVAVVVAAYLVRRLLLARRQAGGAADSVLEG